MATWRFVALFGAKQREAEKPTSLQNKVSYPRYSKYLGLQLGLQLDISWQYVIFKDIIEYLSLIMGEHKPANKTLGSPDKSEIW